MWTILKVVGGALTVLVALFVAHPWIFGLPDRIQEIHFRSGLHRGMTREAVSQLAGGRSGARIEFITFATICIASGIAYDLSFDNAGQLTQWRTEDTGGAC